MRIEGCKRRKKHLFVGSGKNKGKEEKVLDVRYALLLEYLSRPDELRADMTITKPLQASSQVFS